MLTQERSTRPTIDIVESLQRSEHPLVIGVGGGNDSVSALVLLDSLREQYGFKPRKLSVACMLPDCLEYRGLQNTSIEGLSVVTPAASRWRDGVQIKAFPETILAGYKEQFGITELLAFHMNHGSLGVAAALNAATSRRGYDLVLAVDVGGDFIAAKENHEVLSPFMDGYALFGLQQLTKVENRLPILGAVFGLGTDGESSPEMLARALAQVGSYISGEINAHNLNSVRDFYLQKIKPHRTSRTFEYTSRTIERDPSLYEGPLDFKAWLHLPTPGPRSERVEVTFPHILNPAYGGKFFLFDAFQQIHNHFAVACSHGAEWVAQVQAKIERPHHELMGQLYRGAELKPPFDTLSSLTFGSASRKFPEAIRKEMATRSVRYMQPGQNPGILLTPDDLKWIDGEVTFREVNPGTVLATRT